MITSGQLSMYVIVYIDHVADIDFSEILQHSGRHSMCTRKGGGVVLRMEVPPPPLGQRLGQGGMHKCPFPAYLAGHLPPHFPSCVIAFSAFSCVFQPPPHTLCSSFNRSASGAATSSPSPPLPLGHRSTRWGEAHAATKIRSFAEQSL